MPRVSVLMPAYNASAFLTEAIDSILAQSFSDFEFLIIDDGSTDSTSRIIEAYTDPRIVPVKLDSNRGIIHVLNLGLQMCAGEFIVRMDADDIAEPARIARQVEFMEAHKDIGVSGTSVEYFGARSGVIKPPTNHPEILWELMFGPVFFHPSVIIRKDVLAKHKIQYPSNYPHAEDYALWVELVNKTKFANLPEVLLKYRFSSTSISGQHREAQRQMNAVLQRRVISLLALREISDVEWRELDERQGAVLNVKIAEKILAEVHHNISLTDNFRIDKRIKQLILKRGSNANSIRWLIKKSFHDISFVKYLLKSRWEK